MIKKIFISLIILGVISFVFLWTMFSKGIDNQNRLIIFLKETIPIKYSKAIRDTLFIIPDLKKRNEFLSKQVKKYEQGLSGEIFFEQELNTKKKEK